MKTFLIFNGYFVRSISIFYLDKFGFLKEMFIKMYEYQMNVALFMTKILAYISEQLLTGCSTC